MSRGVAGRRVEVGRLDEDGLGVLGGERATRLGGAGLEEERRALRRRGDQVRALDAVARSLVVDPVDLVVVGVDAGHRVLEQRVLVPRALPELVGHVDVLVGPGIALVVRGEALETEVARGVRQVVGDDVPGDPALAGVVEGGDPPREVEGVLLQDRGGERDAEVLGGVGDRAGQHRRVVARDLQPCLEVLPLVTPVRRVEADHVGEEDRVELAALERLGEVDPVVETVEVRLPRVGSAPGSLDDVAGRVHHERGEVEGAWGDLGHGLSPGCRVSRGDWSRGTGRVTNRIRRARSGQLSDTDSWRSGGGRRAAAPWCGNGAPG